MSLPIVFVLRAASLTSPPVNIAASRNASDVFPIRDQEWRDSRDDSLMTTYVVPILSFQPLIRTPRFLFWIERADQPAYRGTP